VSNPEISGILNYLQNKPTAEQAWHALHKYRAEALGDLPAGVTRREASDQAREQLRSRLLSLLVNGDTAGPAVEYALARTEVLRERERQEREVRQRSRDVYTERWLGELRILDDDNFPGGRVSELAINNNLAVLRQELNDELLTELARIQGEARRRLERLLEDLEDAAE
jgi:hypothetical protein